MSNYSTDSRTTTPAQSSAEGRFQYQQLEHDPEVPLAHTLNRSCNPTPGVWLEQEPIRFCADTNLHQIV